MMKKILLASLPVLLIVAGLVTNPAAHSQQSDETIVVRVKGRAGHQLSAQRLDGEKVSNAGYFKLTPGKHSLQVRISYERSGRQRGSSTRHCRATVDYEHFSLGENYDLWAVAVGYTVRLWLRDGSGKRIQEAQRVQCGTQY